MYVGLLSKNEFVAKMAEEKNFTPLGKKIYDYEIIDCPGQTFEV